MRVITTVQQSIVNYCGIRCDGELELSSAKGSYTCKAKEDVLRVSRDEGAYAGLALLQLPDVKGTVVRRSAAKLHRTGTLVLSQLHALE